jgi:hypothetical protein
MSSGTISVKLVQNWVVFLIYIALLSFVFSRHEIWSDELHSWNIAKASTTLADVIYNARYEGHPPVWYVILWSISRVTADMVWMQLAQWLIITSAVFMLIFFSPFPIFTRILIPFGYFFLFEYAVLSRNYAMALLLAFCICLVIRSHLKYRVPLYYVLLFILANTHLLALILAGSLHLYFLLLNKEKACKPGVLLLHCVLGLVVLFPALYFIFPPSDSILSFQRYVSRMHIKEQLTGILLTPFRSFLPIPAWWEYHFWNTQFLLVAQERYRLLKWLTLLVSLALPFLAFFILRGNRKSLVVFIANLAVTLTIAIILPLFNVRYTGFIYIGFIVAYWLYHTETLPGRKISYLVNILLAVQIIAGIVAISGDIRYPFSNVRYANEMLKEVPPGEKLVTDFLGADVLSAYTGKAFYCVELQRELSFIQWKAEYADIRRIPGFYCRGMKALFKREDLTEAYLITLYSREELSRIDKTLLQAFQLELVDERGGSIEKWSNLYLYRVKEQQN